MDLLNPRDAIPIVEILTDMQILVAGTQQICWPLGACMCGFTGIWPPIPLSVDRPLTTTARYWPNLFFTENLVLTGCVVINKFI